MKRRGGIQLSFGMIFSIILIIAIIGVAFYAINYFVGLGKCTEVGLFYRELQDEIDRAWNSEITRDEFTGSLPGGVTNVCFGDVSSGGSGEIYDDLKRYGRADANVYLYPLEKACDQGFRKLEHVDFSEFGGFSCFDVESGRVSIGLEKGSSDSLVKLTRA